jgi:hypothetical protein
VHDPDLVHAVGAACAALHQLTHPQPRPRPRADANPGPGPVSKAPPPGDGEPETTTAGRFVLPASCDQERMDHLDQERAQASATEADASVYVHSCSNDCGERPELELEVSAGGGACMGCDSYGAKSGVTEGIPPFAHDKRAQPSRPSLSDPSAVLWEASR